MSGKLRCYSFHSVKGGVGKSTLAVLTAVGLAQHRKARVTLVDMDLTGTSLADVLPLQAPSWGDAVGEEAPLDLLTSPSDFLSREDSCHRTNLRETVSREALKAGRSEEDVRRVRGVPFLNDFLLFATQDWDAQEEVLKESLLWRLRDGPSQGELRVIPSSALPVDLERIIPVVFDENHSGFLENRLEYLLDMLVPDDGEHVVVVDTPPTIPGLSRCVLSLALRLGRPEKQPLSAKGRMPSKLEAAEVQWTAFLVSTLDHQDLRAANRWLSLIEEDEKPLIQFLVNRVRGSDPTQVQAMLKGIISDADDEPALLFQTPRLVTESSSLEFFRRESAPAIPEEALRFLGDDP